MGTTGLDLSGTRFRPRASVQNHICPDRVSDPGGYVHFASPQTSERPSTDATLQVERPGVRNCGSLVAQEYRPCSAIQRDVEAATPRVLWRALTPDLG